MNWPTHTDYQDAVQDPAFCFQDEDLKGGTVACDMLGLPRVMSGNFASVYEVRSGERRWALRCLVRQVVNLQARYAVLTQHLERVATPFLVGFEFQLRGIRVHNQWYPIVKMDWVPGDPLHVFIERHHREADTLRRLADQFVGLLGDLRRHQVAHGDLQHGNILVTPGGDLRLVDYDGMWVPAFGRGRSPELGHANYQHPQRGADFYTERLDDFSALVIYTSLLGVAAEPDLWPAFHTGDNLLLSAEDFEKPQLSRVIGRLKTSSVARVKALAAVLERCCYGLVAQVPRLEDALHAVEQGTSIGGGTETGQTGGGVPDWLAELPTEPTPRKETRPAPTATVGSTPSMPATRVPQTAPMAPDASGKAAVGVNPWAWAAIVLAGLSVIPALRLWAGGGAVAAGVIGLRKDAKMGGRNAGLAILSGLIGLSMVVLATRSTKPRPGTEAERPPVAEETTSANLTTAPVPDAVVPSTRPLDPLSPPAIVDYSRLAKIRVVAAHSKAVTSLEFFPDGRTWISGGLDGSARLWGDDGAPASFTLSGHADGVARLVAPANAKTLITVSEYNLVRAWDRQTGRLLRSYSGFEDGLWPVAITPDGRTIAAGDRDRKLVRLADLESGAVKRWLPPHTSWVRTVDFSPDGSLLATSCFDDTIHVWDLLTGDALTKLSVPSNQVGRVTFSRDGVRVATGLDGRLARLWQARSGMPGPLLAGHTADVLSAAFSPEGRIVATGAADRTVRFWTVASGALLRTLSEQPAAVTTLAWHPDGRRILSGTADGSVTAWDAQKLGLLDSVGRDSSHP